MNATETLTKKDLFFMIASSFKKIEGATHANVTITPSKIYIEYIAVTGFNIQAIKGGLGALLGAKYTSLKNASLNVGMQSVVKSEAMLCYTDTDEEGNVTDSYYPSALFSFAKKAYTCHTYEDSGNSNSDKIAKFFGF